jgi:arabinan endo-1,5-alpha-L-arabinosidase
MKRMLLSMAFLGMLLTGRSQNCDTNLFPNGREYYDTYHDVAADLPNWKHYNTHDPTVNKQGDWYYMYSTDASWAGLNKTGALKRRSKDLVNWEFLGNAFDGVPQSAKDYFLIHNPSYTDAGIWAPFLLKYRNKYILYYSAPGGLSGVNYAFIGYAISDSAGGPWEDKGMITTSYRDTINAIDPTVVYDSVNQRLWMAYGSWERGIHILELDTATGGIKTPGDRGVKIARRKTTAEGLEGAEISYRNGWYYLFVSYDALGDLYNVRVGRSRNANGPYYDFNDVDMAQTSSNIPMIQAPYRFNNHIGWQGTGHCGVYNDNGKYYMFNQGRPSIEPAMMVLHVREIFWIDDWPVVSPERYAGVPDCPVTADSIPGDWEHMRLKYHSTTVSDFHSTSEALHMDADGTFNGKTNNTWTFNQDTLILNWNTGVVDKLVVFHGWDWENSCRTILYTGISKTGSCSWGKKVNQTEVDRHTLIIEGATYTLRNLYSHKLMNVTADTAETRVRQGADNGQSGQQWKIKNAGNGYSYLFPQNNTENLAMEVRNGKKDNFTGILVNPLDGSDKQMFKMVYNGNGYFHILTRVTNDLSCAEVISYSLEEGGTINENTYSGALNQLFRLTKVDSIPIDTVSADTFPSGINRVEFSSVTVYPNPSRDGRLFIDLASLKESGDIRISILDLSGVNLYNATLEKQSVYKPELVLEKGMYIVRIYTGTKLYVSKLVVQ